MSASCCASSKKPAVDPRWRRALWIALIINAVMFPLRHKSMVSMRKMQEIQPQVKAIQDRYANLKATDPARQTITFAVLIASSISRRARP